MSSSLSLSFPPVRLSWPPTSSSTSTLVAARGSKKTKTKYDFHPSTKSSSSSALLIKNNIHNRSSSSDGRYASNNIKIDALNSNLIIKRGRRERNYYDMAGDDDDDDNDDDNRNKNNNTKEKKTRKRHIASPGTLISTNTANDDYQVESLLWIDKYEPRSKTELCVASKKINEVESWIRTFQNHNNHINSSGSASGMNTQIENKINTNSTATTAISSSPKLLILVGCPGIGKSTMIKVLAKELNFDVKEWNDTYTTRFFDSTSSSNNRHYFMDVQQESPIQLFEKFLKQNSVGFHSLDISTNTNVTDNNTSNDKKNTSNNERGSLILIDELPNLHTIEAERKFRQIMSDHLCNTHKVPTVLIFSNTKEGKHRPEDLERLIETEYLYSNFTQIMQINTVTKVKLKKVVATIAKNEKLHTTATTTEFYEQLHLQSEGDLRHAITTLQFESVINVSNNNRKKQNGYDNCFSSYPSCSQNRRNRSHMNKKNNNGSNENKKRCLQTYKRDVKLSMFHGLGKILYAKRVPPSITTMNSKSSIGRNNTKSSNSYYPNAHNPHRHRPPLEFIPEDVLESCDIELSGATAFLQYHCTDFYTDIDELSEAFDGFSDAVLLADHQPTTYRRQNEYSKFPDRYVASLIGRTIADTNKHPTKSKFRQLSAPKVFEVMRKRRENLYEFRHLQRRLSIETNLFSPNFNAVGSTKAFVTDCLPYLNLIAPGTNSSLNRIRSYFSSSDATQNDGKTRKEEEAELIKKDTMEQEKVLQEDDIEDDSSDDNSDNSGNGDDDTYKRRKCRFNKSLTFATTSPEEENHHQTIRMKYVSTKEEEKKDNSYAGNTSLFDDSSFLSRQQNSSKKVTNEDNYDSFHPSSSSSSTLGMKMLPFVKYPKKSSQPEIIIIDD